MPLVINTNVASLSAQNSMNRAQMDQNEAMERLTTGKRINTAADDAAGLSIANKMTSQVRGLNQAVRNANDGISMLQTAAGGLEESSNILQRMRELSVQSASGTYTEGNRDSMQAEVEQLKAELDRISETTTFNGQTILDGSQQDTQLQVGANANETIGFSIGSTAARDLGGVSADIVGNGIATADLLTGLKTAAGDGTNDLIINGQNAGDLSGAVTLEDALTLINDNIVGVEAGVAVEIEASSQGDGVITAAQSVKVDIAHIDGTTTSFEITATASMDDVVNQINEKGNGRITADVTEDGRLVMNSDDSTAITLTANGGVSLTDSIGMAAGDFADKTQFTLTAEPGTDDVTVEYTGAVLGAIANIGVDQRQEAGVITGNADVTVAATGTDLREGDLIINGVQIGEIESGATKAETHANVIAAINAKLDETGVVAAFNVDKLTLTSTDGNEISVEQGKNATAADFTSLLGVFETNSTKGSVGSVDAINISTAAGAQRAIETLDEAINQVSEIQSNLGAVNNRLDFTVNNLSNVSENASAARSRIEDADFAAESANLSRAKVLQQAGQTMLAQANSAPQQVLSLLQ